MLISNERYKGTASSNIKKPDRVRLISLLIQVSVKVIIIVIKVVIKHIVVSVVKHITRVVKAEE